MQSYLTIHDIAKKLQVTAETVLHWIASGDLKAYNLTRNRGKNERWRVAEADLELFLCTRAQVPTPPVTRTRRRVGDRPEFVRYFSRGE